MKVKVLDNKCSLTKGYRTDAGFDLKARYQAIIKPSQTVKIHTGVCVEVPEGYAGDIRPRSSISLRGILVHYGTVDHGYTGEIGITITNLNKATVKIERYERIAQLVITKICEDNKIEIVEELPTSIRGERGFGSTGK